MKKVSALAAIALAFTTVAVQAQANDTGSWLVRGRLLHLQSANEDTTGLGLSINDKTFPELDISYFVTPNIATELILTYPQKHTLYSKGSEIGNLKHLPPTLLLQYHLTGLGSVRPYAGLGVNFTNFSDVHFTPAVVSALHPNVKRTSYGLAVQVGMDVPLSGGWSLNVDVKKVKLATDVYSGTATAGKFTVDPLLVSVGAGYRF
jgi:outer membrane protein